MRVSTGSRADVPPYKPAPNACDATVEIGEVEDYTINIYEDGEPVSLFNNTTVCLGDSTSFIDASYTYSLRNAPHAFHLTPSYTLHLTPRLNYTLHLTYTLPSDTLNLALTLYTLAYSLP